MWFSECDKMLEATQQKIIKLRIERQNRIETLNAKTQFIKNLILLKQEADAISG